LKLINTTALLALTLFISACSSNKINIETEYSKATNFKDFKYYRWEQKAANPETKSDKAAETAQAELGSDQAEKIKSQKEAEKLLDQNIRFMIDQQLADKGMIKKEYGQVDFLVHYSGASKSAADVEQQQVYDTYATNLQSYGGGHSYSGRYYSGVGIGMTVQSSTREEMMVDRYREGVMSINFLEPDNKELIWTAKGEKRLPYDKPDAVERDKLIKKAINKLLANFPPK
jgi:hypothetical protein